MSDSEPKPPLGLVPHGPKFFIVGHGRHGKDEVAEMLAKKMTRVFRTPFLKCSSSWFACENFIFSNLSGLLGYKTFSECYGDRHRHRNLWKDLIAQYVKEDEAALASELFKQYQIYVGPRRLAEYQECRKRWRTLSIFVDASQRVGEGDETLEIGPEDCDIIIKNNGNLSELDDKIENLVATFERCYQKP